MAMVFVYSASLSRVGLRFDITSAGNEYMYNSKLQLAYPTESVLKARVEILDVLVNIARELEELLCGARRLLLGSLVTLGLAAALNSQELVDGIRLGRSLSGTGLGLNSDIIQVNQRGTGVVCT